MYDKDVCKAGIGLCLVIGGTVITGWWVIGIALALLVAGVAVGRYLYRRAQGDESGEE